MTAGSRQGVEGMDEEGVEAGCKGDDELEAIARAAFLRSFCDSLKLGAGVGAVSDGRADADDDEGGSRGRVEVVVSAMMDRRSVLQTQGKGMYVSNGSSKADDEMGAQSTYFSASTALDFQTGLDDEDDGTLDGSSSETARSPIESEPASPFARRSTAPTSSSIANRPSSASSADT